MKAVLRDLVHSKTRGLYPMFLAQLVLSHCSDLWYLVSLGVGGWGALGNRQAVAERGRPKPPTLATRARVWEKLLGAAGMPWECGRCSWGAPSKPPRAPGAAPPGPGRRLKQPAAAAVRSAARTIRFQNSFAVTPERRG